MTRIDTARIVRVMQWFKIAKERARELGLTQEQIAEALGVSRGAVGHYLAGRREPEIAGLRTLAKTLRLTYGELMGETPATHVREMAPAYGDERVYLTKIRGAHLSAGAGTVIYDFEELEEHLSFRRDWMSKEGLDPKRCRLWEVAGDSMYPTIPSGSMVLVNSAEREPASRRIYAILTDEGLRLKRLIRRADGVWEIHSDNPDKNQYPNEVFTPGQVAIIGRVRWYASTV